MKLITFAIMVIFIKLILNLYNYLRTKTLHKYFEEFLDGKRSNMNIYRQEILTLFKKSNIQDVHTPVTEPAGFGKIITATVSVFSMIPSTRSVFSAVTLNMFEEAEGFFRKNIFDAVNPFFWLELLVFLPKNILIYLGFDIEKSASKLWNVLLTFIWWVFCTLITLFQPEIKQLIVELFGNSQ